MKIMITDNNKFNSAFGWKQKDIEFEDLEHIVKNHIYSAAILDDSGNRKQENFKHASNFIIYDIDNDDADKRRKEKKIQDLSIIQAENYFRSMGIKTFIIPSKSHQIEKFTADKKTKDGDIIPGYSKGVKDRFRIIIPVQGNIEDINSPEIYKEYAKLLMTDLNMSDHADTSPLNNATGLYYSSLQEAKPIAIDGEILDISYYTELAKKEALKAGEKIKQKGRKVSRGKSEKKDKVSLGYKEQEKYKDPDIEIKREYPKGSTYIQLVDFNQLSELKARDFVFGNVVQDGANEFVVQTTNNHHLYYQDGKSASDRAYYLIKKTDVLTKQVGSDIYEVDLNAVYDLKDDKPIDALQVIMNNTGEKNPLEVAKSLGDRFYYTNIPYVKQQMEFALETAKNDREFETSIKQSLGLNYFKLGKDHIEFLNEKEPLEKFGISKQEIIQCFKDNRATEQERER